MADFDIPLQSRDVDEGFRELVANLNWFKCASRHLSKSTVCKLGALLLGRLWLALCSWNYGVLRNVRSWEFDLSFLLQRNVS